MEWRTATLVGPVPGATLAVLGIPEASLGPSLVLVVTLAHLVEEAVTPVVDTLVQEDRYL